MQVPLVFRRTVWGWACPRKHSPVAVDALDLSSGVVLAVTPSISETWVLALRTPGGPALRSSLAGRGHSPSYLVLGQCPQSTRWGESGSALSLKGGVPKLSLSASEGAKPSRTAVGTLSQLSFHPHESRPAPRLPPIQMWLEHPTWFWPPWMDIEQRAWLGAKVVDLPGEGASGRRHRPQGPGSFCRPELTNLELGIQY